MIELRNVSFTYREGQRSSLHNINIKIEQGEVLLVCGESGCGKTTFTRLINGLIPNYYHGSLKGRVLIDGQEVGKSSIYKTAERVGSVFQNPRSQFFNVDTNSELAFASENRGLSVEVIRKRIKSTVKDLNIQYLMGKNIFQLSGGEKQKIACGSVSVADPDIYVLDEPSSNLDVKAIEDLRRLIAIWKEEGKTIIIAEHRLYFLREIVDRFIYLRNGRIEEEFNSQEIMNLNSKKLSQLGLRTLFLEDLKKDQGVSVPVSVPVSEKLVLDGFTFSYQKGRNVLDIDHIDILQRGIIAVIGHNGAGKSTFAHCLCGLKRGFKGKLSYRRKEYSSKQLLQLSYMVMQDVNHQLFTEAVLDEVLLSMEKPDTAEAEAILDDFDLLSLKNLHPMSLSGGQKQRVAVASAVVSDKDIIIFDEPSSGLDLRHMREVSASIKQLQLMGKTIFVITHDLELILESCTHVLHLDKGKIADSYSLDKCGELKLKSYFNVENVSDLLEKRLS